jgi:hypothetical protein
MAVRLTALHTRHTLLPRNIIIVIIIIIIIIIMFLVLISVRLSKPQGLLWPEGLFKFKNSPHLVSNPQPSGIVWKD